VVLIVYWTVLGDGYVWDDWILLDVFNPAGLRDPTSWRDGCSGRLPISQPCSGR